jgi:hypothetical protein
VSAGATDHPRACEQRGATVHPGACDLNAGRVSLRSALVEVLSSPGRVAGLVVVAVGVGLLYSVLLPYDYTQRFAWHNWHYLNGRLLTWAVALGLGLGFVVCIQVYAVRRVVAARAPCGAAGVLAFVASLAPSLLCCSPIVPTFLAFVGVSGVGLYTTSGTLQHFFAVHQTQFLSASLALLVVTGWWGLRKIATAACLAADGCGVDHSGDTLVSGGPGASDADGNGRGVRVTTQRPSNMASDEAALR